MPSVKCPQCSGTNVKTLRMIHASGTRQSESTYTRAGSVFASGSRRGMSQSNLSAEAAPPSRGSSCLVSLILALVVGIVVFFVGANAAQREVNTPLYPTLLLAVATLTAIIPLIILFVGWRVSKADQAKYEEDIEAYARTWLCLRCGARWLV